MRGTEPSFLLRWFPTRQNRRVGRYLYLRRRHSPRSEFGSSVDTQNRVVRKKFSRTNLGRILGTRRARPKTDRAACPQDDHQSGRASAAVTSHGMAQSCSGLDARTIARVAGDVSFAKT